MMADDFMKQYQDGGFRPKPGIYATSFIIIGERGYPTSYHGLEEISEEDAKRRFKAEMKTI
jgi:hypothetical protein